MDLDFLITVLEQDLCVLELSSDLKQHVSDKLKDTNDKRRTQKMYDLKTTRTKHEHRAAMATRGVWTTDEDRHEALYHNKQADRANHLLNNQFNRKERLILRLKRDKYRQQGVKLPKVDYYNNNNYTYKEGSRNTLD